MRQLPECDVTGRYYGNDDSDDRRYPVRRANYQRREEPSFVLPIILLVGFGFAAIYCAFGLFFSIVSLLVYVCLVVPFKLWRALTG